eukprot:tig00000249_g22150.t1
MVTPSHDRRARSLDDAAAAAGAEDDGGELELKLTLYALVLLLARRRHERATTHTAARTVPKREPSDSSGNASSAMGSPSTCERSAGPANTGQSAAGLELGLQWKAPRRAAAAALARCRPGSDQSQLRGDAANIADVLSELRLIRVNVPDKSPELSEIDSALAPLALLFRSMQAAGLADAHPALVTPKQFDVLLTDIRDRSDLESIAQLFGVAYLAEARRTAAPLLPVAARRGRAVFAPFIIDTGSPHTYVSGDVIEALGLSSVSALGATLLVNGRPATVYESHSHFSKACVLGASYFVANRLASPSDTHR